MSSSMELQEMILQAQDKVAKQGALVREIRSALRNQPEKLEEFQEAITVLNNLKNDLDKINHDYEKSMSPRV